MDLSIYIYSTVIYIMVIHFALGIAKEFNIFLLISMFAIGGAIGWYLDSYITGFVFAIISSFLLYNNTF